MMEMDARTQALAEHNPPAKIWFDEDDEIRRRCITDQPNPDCAGCQEPGEPPDEFWFWQPRSGWPA